MNDVRETALALASDIFGLDVKHFIESPRYCPRLPQQCEACDAVALIAAALEVERKRAVAEERARLIRQIARECRHIRSGDPLWRILGDPQ